MGLGSDILINRNVAFIGSDVNWSLPVGATYEIFVPLSGAFDSQTKFSTSATGVTINVVRFDPQGVVLQVILAPTASIGNHSLVVKTGPYSNEDLDNNLSTNADSRLAIQTAVGVFSVNGKDVTDFQQKFSKKIVYVSSLLDLPTAVGGEITCEDQTVYWFEDKLTDPSNPTIKVVAGTTVEFRGHNQDISGYYSNSGSMLNVSDANFSARDMTFGSLGGQLLACDDAGAEKNITFQNCLLDGDDGGAKGLIGEIAGFKNITFQNCEIKSFAEENIYMYDFETLKVEGCRYYDWEAGDIYVMIYTDGGALVEIKNNLFEGNDDNLCIKIENPATKWYISNNIFQLGVGTLALDDQGAAGTVDGLVYGNIGLLDNTPETAEGNFGFESSAFTTMPINGVYYKVNATYANRGAGSAFWTIVGNAFRFGAPGYLPDMNQDVTVTGDFERIFGSGTQDYQFALFQNGVIVPISKTFIENNQQAKTFAFQSRINVNGGDLELFASRLSGAGDIFVRNIQINIK